MLKEQLAILLQIQDCELILKESNIMHGTNHDHDTEDLEAKIAELREKVEDKHLKHYDRMKEKGLGVAKEVNGRCKACHMVINVGDLGRMQKNQAQPICPSCNVYLYLESYDEEA